MNVVGTNFLRRRRAFTAVEALVAAAILAVLTAAVSGALMAGRQQSKLSRDTMYASMLGRALLDEIVRLPAKDPVDGITTIMGPDAGEARIPAYGSGQTQFNCVKDYNGYTDGPGVVNGQATTTVITQLALTTDSAVAYPTVYQPFVRTVTVAPVSYSPSGWSLPQPATGLLVTVTVTRDGMPLVCLQRVAFY